MKQRTCLLFWACSFLLFGACRYKEPSTCPIEQALNTYDMSTIIETLHYDPCITVYPSTHPVNDSNHVTLYVHGWGESQHTIPFLKANSWLLPETVIGFNFQDAHADTGIPHLKKSNFCQTNDIATLIAVLKVLDECALPTLHMVGTSGGGGTILTAIDRLMHYKRHKKFFKRLSISPQQAERILEKIKAGTIVLNCPLADLSMSVREKLAPYGTSFLSPLLTHIIMPCITDYSPRKDSPLKAAVAVQKLELPILVHFQKDNLIVGNDADAPLYEALKGPHTYLVLGNDGGHSHRGETLAPALHAFRKKYNGPHITDADMLGAGASLLDQSPSYTTDCTPYIHNFYTHKTYHFTPNTAHKWQEQWAAYDTKSVATALGYNPVLRIYQADTRVQGNSTTVYAHGYGDNYKFTIPLFQLNSYLLPGTVVGFNFQDVTEGAFKVKIGKSSVGQTADIASLATVLKTLDECDLDTIHLFGYSRGGATIITTLGRLCEYDNHTDFFNHLNIGKPQAQRIITKIQAGTIILNCPLVDSQAVAHYWFGKLDSFVMKNIIPRIMEHRADADQAINAAHIIQPMNFKILVHFQKHDTVLGNTPVDALFYNNLKGPHTYLVIADEGGHMHTGKTLSSAVQAFRKKYNGAYYPIKKLLKEGDALLKQSPCNTTAVNNYVARMYA